MYKWKYMYDAYISHLLHIFVTSISIILLIHVTYYFHIIVKKVFRENISTLEEVIKNLVTIGGTNAHYRKALECIKVNIRIFFSLRVIYIYIFSSSLYF